ncbi:GH32 C-terminal domain-containing protein [Aureimonas frigidaquae]|uniref:GH32 C-terminal domain-containing protein n=1 Tax=Aureimonas frigidaquae TaxID=424757 RepID=UPI000783CA9D|nr:GH32 C-terminal domain-containing protein [Aureimonas frigidaquae]
MPHLATTVRIGDIIDLWLRPAKGGARSRLVLEVGGIARNIDGGPTDDFQRHSLTMEADGTARLSFDPETTELSLAYAYTPARVMDEGIRLLHTSERNGNEGRRFALHLQPPFGWMNDPNGLFEQDGVTHAFYQHYPHGRRWNTMHWGHAVSHNLVDWVHLPIFLDPPAHMLADDAKVGGAFSGSAQPQPDGSVRVFFTDRDDDRKPRMEWQMSALSQDLLNVGPAQALITDAPPLEGFGRDLRDPYVFRGPDGLWKMLLGGADTRGGLVLLYESTHPQGAADWRFVGVLHEEPCAPSLPVECPCMLPLTGEGEGLHVLIFGLIGYRDPSTRRRNLSFALIGRFDGARFAPIARQELDFIADSYAFQGFVHAAHGPMGLAWAANWTDVFKDRDFPSAMTLPRRLVWRDHALSTPVVDSVTQLRSAVLADDPAALAGGVALPDGLAEIELTLCEPDAPFQLDFAHGSHRIALTGDGRSLELCFEPPGARVVPRYATEVTGLTQLRIFVDVGLIEVYAQDGRWCGTKRIDSDEPVSAVRLTAGGVARARVFALRPARGLPPMTNETNAQSASGEE